MRDAIDEFSKFSGHSSTLQIIGHNFIESYPIDVKIGLRIE